MTQQPQEVAALVREIVDLREELLAYLTAPGRTATAQEEFDHRVRHVVRRCADFGVVAEADLLELIPFLLKNHDAERNWAEALGSLEWLARSLAPPPSADGLRGQTDGVIAVLQQQHDEQRQVDQNDSRLPPPGEARDLVIGAQIQRDKNRALGSAMSPRGWALYVRDQYAKRGITEDDDDNGVFLDWLLHTVQLDKAIAYLTRLREQL